MQGGGGHPACQCCAHPAQGWRQCLAALSIIALTVDTWLFDAAVAGRKWATGMEWLQEETTVMAR